MKTKLIGMMFGAAVALGAVQSANAAEQWVEGTLQFVYPQGDGSFIVSFSGTQPAGCTSAANPKYFEVRAGQNGVNADGVKNLLAAALGAQLSGKVVQLAFENSTPNCFVNRLRIVS